MSHKIKIKSSCGDIHYHLNKIKEAVREIADEADDTFEEGLNGNLLILNVINYADREKILNFIRKNHWNVLDNSKF